MCPRVFRKKNLSKNLFKKKLFNTLIISHESPVPEQFYASVEPGAGALVLLQICISLNKPQSARRLLRSISAVSLPYHWSNVVMDLIKLWQITAAPSPLCSLWAAGWWLWVHSLSLRGTEAGRGCLCTPGRPSWLCPGSVCWGGAPAACSRSTAFRTAERGLWRASGPDPFPEEKETRTRLNSKQLFGIQRDTAGNRKCRRLPSAKNWPFSSPSHRYPPSWHNQSASRKRKRRHNYCVWNK